MARTTENFVLLSCLAVGAGLTRAEWFAVDPRDSARVAELEKTRESASFRERLRRGDSTTFVWPGLSAAQTSWTWLQVLYGLHKPESYKGDFSWIFSKLDTILQSSNPQEMSSLASLAPFYMVIGEDYAGATLIMNEMIRRGGKRDWRIWFWGGFHALENLRARELSADLYRQAAVLPGSPPYLAALQLRLKENLPTSGLIGRREALREMDPRLLEKLRASRPEWVRELGNEP